MTFLCLHTFVRLALYGIFSLDIELNLITITITHKRTCTHTYTHTYTHTHPHTHTHTHTHTPTHTRSRTIILLILTRKHVLTVAHTRTLIKNTRIQKFLLAHISYYTYLPVIFSYHCYRTPFQLYRIINLSKVELRK